MSFLYNLHSGFRWLVIAISILALIWFVLTALKVVANPRVDRIAMLGFIIGVDTQVLIGLILFVVMLLEGAAQGYQIGHLVIMVVAVGVAHMLSRRTRNAESLSAARSNIITIVVVLILIVIGVLALPGGSSRWMLMPG